MSAPPSFEELPDLATVAQVAAFLQVGENRCREWVKGEDLAIRLGKRIRVSKIALARHLGLDNTT